MDNVLKLNASYEPLEVIDYRKAITMLLDGKVESVSDSKRIVRSPSIQLSVPSVVKLKRYAYIPHRAYVIAPTKKAVMRRDSYKCAYCRKKANTVDHVVPKSKGGKHVWANLTACCMVCNQKKGNKTLHQLGWKIHNKIHTPKHDPSATIVPSSEDWMPFLRG